MKAKFLLFSLILFINSMSFSQIIKSIGIKSGLSISNQKWEHSQINNKKIIKLLAGNYNVITIDFIKKQNWDLAADFGFFQSCSKIDANPYLFYNSTIEYQGDIRQRFGFFTFSPILRLKTQIKSFTPYIQFGPRLDFYTSAFSNDNADYWKNDINKTQYGFHIGEGVAYNFKNFSILAEYQFFFNFNKLMDKPTIYPIANFTRDIIKINTHIISLGVKYHFKKEE